MHVQVLHARAIKSHTVHFLLQEFPFPLSMTMIHILANFIVVWVCRRTLFLWSKELRPVLPWKLYVHHIIPVGKVSSAYVHSSQLTSS